MTKPRKTNYDRAVSPHDQYKLKIIKEMVTQMDDNLLYGRPLGRVYPNRGTPRPSYKEIAEYRRSHLSSRILRAVDKLLSGRRTAEVDSNDDIIVCDMMPHGPGSTMK